MVKNSVQRPILLLESYLANIRNAVAKFGEIVIEILKINFPILIRIEIDINKVLVLKPSILFFLVFLLCLSVLFWFLL